MIQKYGIKFGNPVFEDPWRVELMLWGNDELRENAARTLSKWEHLRNAIKCLFPEDVFKWHRWVDDLGEAYCDTNILTVWGASSTTKSGMAGMLALMDLMYDPGKTYTLLITNPIDKHDDRMFGSMIKWRSNLPKQLRLGKLRKQNPKGLITSSDDGQRTGVVAISNKPGDSFQDLKRFLGVHVPRVRLIVDEPQGCSHSVLKVRNNLGASGEYKELFIGNPDSWLSPLGKHSEPADHDRKYIQTRQPDRWETINEFNGKPGLCIVFDGRKAPSFDSKAEAKRLDFMIQPGFAKSITANEGTDSRYYWSYIVGRIPPEGLLMVPITEQDLVGANAMAPAVWESGYTEYAGFDGSTGAKDKIVLYRIRVGTIMGGATVMAVAGRDYCKPAMTKGNISGQIGEWAAKTLDNWGVPVSRLAADSSGNQGALIDAIENAVGSRGAFRVSAEGGPSERRVHTGVPQTCKERYQDRATELVMTLAEFCRFGQVRGLDSEVVHQITTRNIDQERDDDSNNRRIKLCPKKEWRMVNGGRSPDELDSVACVSDMLYTKGVLAPGTGTPLAESQTTGWAEMRERLDRRKRWNHAAMVSRNY